MATASVTYQPAAGRAYVDLTSWAGTASFTTTPVAADQIEGPDTLTLNADGTVTGADGTYTLRHIQAANGTTEGISYSISSPDATAPVLTSPTATVTGSTTIDGTVTTDEANGTLYALASANATETASTVKTSGQSQAVSATGVQSVSITGLTASTAYYVHFMHEDTAGNQSSVSTSAQVTTDAAIAGGATTTVPYQAASGQTAVTLVSGFDPYIFQDWATQPVVGEQIVFTDAELTIDSLANVTTDTEGVFDIWFVELDGTVTATTVDTTGLTATDGTTPADTTAPVITSISVPANAIYGIGETLSFTANWSEAVTVTGIPAINLDIGGSARQANYASGSGSTSTLFHYTVQEGDEDTNGISATSLSLDGGTIRDAAGNNATLTLNGVGDTVGVLVDGTPVDTVRPVIQLTGASEITLAIGEAFVDPGATASDDVDGDLTGSIQTAGSVDTTKDSTNLIVYSVSDLSGNVASITRRVIVGQGRVTGRDRSIIARSIRSDRPARSDTVALPIASKI